MKIATPAKKIKFKIIFITNLILSFTTLSQANAWDGYDYNNKIEIEIGSGNLVREGLIIQFYDGKDNSYHSAQVILIESIAGGTRIKIKDLDSDKKRVFIME